MNGLDKSMQPARSLWWRWPSALGSLLAVTLLLVASGDRTEACEPPFTAWDSTHVFPTSGSDAPLNGIVTVRLDFRNESGSIDWPDPTPVVDTVQLSLSRGDEVVDGVVEFDPLFGEVRFVSDLPLAEGIEYTASLELINSHFGFVEDVFEEYTFTTGTRFDEVGPAFSGLQSLTVTELPQADEECCEPAQDYCIEMCGLCSWCWTVAWQYVPLIELSFRSVQDEFGPESVRYAVYELDAPDAELGEPRLVVSTAQTGEEQINLTVEGDGPYCFAVRARDAFGRWDNNSVVTCGSLDDTVPISRLDVPEPNREHCADLPSEDVGDDGGAEDTGVDAAHDSGDPLDAGTPDNGSSEDEDPVTINPSSGEDDCGCELRHPTGPRWPLLIAIAIGVAVVGRRRR